MPSLDGHLVNWVTLFKERISTSANQGRSPQRQSHTEAGVQAENDAAATAALLFWGQMSVLNALRKPDGVWRKWLRSINEMN